MPQLGNGPDNVAELLLFELIQQRKRTLAHCMHEGGVIILQACHSPRHVGNLLRFKFMDPGHNLWKGGVREEEVGVDSKRVKMWGWIDSTVGV